VGPECVYFKSLSNMRIHSRPKLKIDNPCKTLRKERLRKADVRHDGLLCSEILHKIDIISKIPRVLIYHNSSYPQLYKFYKFIRLDTCEL